MPDYSYTAIAASGARLQGVMQADDERAVILRLQQQGSMAMLVQPASAIRGGFWENLTAFEFTSAKTLRRQEVADATRELAIMLSAGLDLDAALRFLVEMASNVRVRSVMEELRDAVRNGASFSAALAQHPRSFSRLYLGLVRAGEAGPNLPATLDHLAALLERERALASTISSALIYPALLLVASIGAIVLLLTQVLPNFLPLFEQNGAALPSSTRMLIATGAFVADHGLHMVAGLAVLGLMIRYALLWPGMRLAADRALLHLPVIGTLAREIVAARLARTLGTLLVDGVSLIAALAIVRDVIGNRAAVAALDAAAQAAKQGAGLAGELGAAGIFPVRMIYLVRLGEETAQLGVMALRAAEMHEQRTRLGVERLVSLLVPAITLLMGAAVAAIVSSMLLAMLGLNDLAH